MLAVGMTLLLIEHLPDISQSSKVPRNNQSVEHPHIPADATFADRYRGDIQPVGIYVVRRFQLDTELTFFYKLDTDLRTLVDIGCPTPTGLLLRS